jgi:hypothetical protein
MICIIECPSLALQACTPIFAEAQFAFFALIFLRDSTAMARSPELARLFQQPDLENHWEPMRNRALPSVMVQGQERTERWPDQERTSILNRFASLLAWG